MRESDFVTHLRAADNMLIDAFDKIAALRKEWDARGFVNTLPDEVFAEKAEHEGLTKEDLAGFFTSIDAVEDKITTGFHWTNLYKLR